MSEWSSFKEQVREQIRFLKRSKPEEGWTSYVTLYTDSFKERWAIVMAWMDYDNNGNWKIYGKIASQPTNSLMQEYDIDWLMPIEESYGFDGDTEIQIESEVDIDWLFKEWEWIYEEIRKLEDDMDESEEY